MWHSGNGCAAPRCEVVPGGWRCEVVPGGWRSEVVPGGWRSGVVAVQVIEPHEADELRAIIRIRCIDAREGCRERIRILTVSHSLPVVLTGGEEPAVIVDALGDIVVRTK